MAVCICGPSALEVLRASGRLAPELLERPRTSKVCDFDIPPLPLLADDLERFGAKTRPFHVLVPDGVHHSHTRKDVCRHVKSKVPAKSLVQLGRGVYVTSPELTFCDLATQPEFDEIELAQVCYELCGTYVLDPDADSWTGYTELPTPLTSREAIARVLGRLGPVRGTVVARRAVAAALDRSNSPMETVLASLMTMPRRLGGLGLSGASMNHPIQTSVGPRRVDVAFPELKVGFEYKGTRPHSIEATGRDDRRQNKLAGSGVAILNVWYEDLVDGHLFRQFVADATKAMGIRLRISSVAFEGRQRMLRMQLIPRFRRWASLMQ